MCLERKDWGRRAEEAAGALASRSRWCEPRHASSPSRCFPVALGYVAVCVPLCVCLADGRGEVEWKRDRTFRDEPLISC